MLAYLISGVTYGFAAAVSPGPLSMYLMSQAVSRGWRKALPVAFSPLITDGPVAVLVLALLSQVPTSLVSYLRVLGGALILYLAYEAWKSWRSFNAEDSVAAATASNSLLKAILINWLNPNLYIGWSVILGPIVLSGWHTAPANGVAVVVGFYATIVVVMTGMVLLFSAAKTLGTQARKNLIGLSSIALAGLGLYQLLHPWIVFVGEN
jgi:threonine/homoserine/homoserine lactone efflux protein